MADNQTGETMKGIIFSAESVRAILDGRKTQTRRVIIPQPEFEQIYRYKGKVLYECENRVWCWKEHVAPYMAEIDWINQFTPYQPGQILWVRETWQEFFTEEVTPEHQRGPRSSGGVPAETAKGNYMYFYYRADGEIPNHPKYGKACWRPSIHMPEKAARLFLKVKSVRVERLQEITEKDAKAEGVLACTEFESHIHYDGREYRCSFERLWDSRNANRGRGWYRNPWVWVIEFERVEE